MRTSDWEILGWDSEHFEFLTARLRADLPAKDLPKALFDLRAAKVTLAYYSLPKEDTSRRQAAHAGGGQLVDIRTTFSGPIPRVLKLTQSASGPLEETIGPMTPALQQLALQAGIHSRFSTDPRFPHDRFVHLYTTWLSRSLSHHKADVVFVTSDKHGPTGLVTVKGRDSRAEIGLLSVASRARGKGLAIALIRQAAQWATEKQFASGTVVTQEANSIACQLYSRCGYSIERQEAVFHFWL